MVCRNTRYWFSRYTLTPDEEKPTTVVSSVSLIQFTPTLATLGTSNRLNLVVGSSWSRTGRACRSAVKPFSPGGEKDSRIQTIADFRIEVIKRINMALVLSPIVSVFFQRNHSGLSIVAAKTRGAIKACLSSMIFQAI